MVQNFVLRSLKETCWKGTISLDYAFSFLHV